MIDGQTVDVWLCREDAITDPALLESYETLMSASERDAWQRLLLPGDRHRHLVTRALVRSVLSEYVNGVLPVDWEFEIGAHGRPEVHPRHGAPWLRFNLAHTAGMVVLGVARERAIGIDVEDGRPRSGLLDIADRFFSPTERCALRGLPAREQRQRFYAVWTLKEAYVKARGLGFALPLEDFSMTLSGEEPSLDFGRCTDTASRWQLALWRPTPEHTVALCVERTTGRDAPLRSRIVIPGGA